MTFLEKLKIEHPERAAEVPESFGRGCPNDYGYESEASSSMECARGHCVDCWNREIPVTENIEKENNTMKPKTKDELIAELKATQQKVVELTDELQSLEKYKSLTQAADELKRIHDVFVNSGFTPDQATILVNTLLMNAIKSVM